jgi:hypothetical protein
MTKAELLEKLKACQVLSEDDEEVAHANADDLLLEFISDPEITVAFESIKRWYA